MTLIRRFCTPTFLTLAVFYLSASQLQAGAEIHVQFPASLSSKPLTGRLILLISTNDEREPRFQLSDRPGSAQAFGLDVVNWAPHTLSLIHI